MCTGDKFKKSKDVSIFIILLPTDGSLLEKLLVTCVTEAQIVIIDLSVTVTIYNPWKMTSRYLNRYETQLIELNIMTSNIQLVNTVNILWTLTILISGTKTTATVRLK